MRLAGFQFCFCSDQSPRILLDNSAEDIEREKFMALKQPTPVGALRAAYLCAIALISPEHFDKIEKQDTSALETAPDATSIQRISRVRNAFLKSFLLVVVSSLVGATFGFAAYLLFGRSDRAIAVLQILGAGTLLWATLAIRGWEVQTFSGATLTERVNQWLYRSLYCLGTSILVLTVVWQVLVSQP